MGDINSIWTLRIKFSNWFYTVSCILLLNVCIIGRFYRIFDSVTASVSIVNNCTNIMIKKNFFLHFEKAKIIALF